jgi:hypothetical protein
MPFPSYTAASPQRQHCDVQALNVGRHYDLGLLAYFRRFSPDPLSMISHLNCNVGCQLVPARLPSVDITIWEWTLDLFSAFLA